MTAPEQQATDPRQPAWDAVFAYIRTLSRDALPGSIVERNAVIWRAVNAALVALGYPDADTQQAAPEQADLRQRILAWREDGDAHELTPEQVEYNIASGELIQLGAYGHCKYWPVGELHPREYLERLHAAQDRFENALLGLVQPELDRLAERVSRVTAVLDSANDQPARIARQALAEEDRLNAELTALREQLDAAQAENERLATALEVATVQHAKAIKDRDKARTSAKISDDIQRAEKQVFDTAIRELGGNPVDVQNLYAQLRSRTQQWKNAQTALANQDAEIERLRALLAHDHAAAYHQGEPRDGHRNCGRDSCTAPAARPSV